MMKRRKQEVDLSIVRIPLTAFLESYNKNIPSAFPRASVSILRKFQSIYPALFKHGDMWSLAVHRKKVIDWLSSYRG